MNKIDPRKHFILLFALISILVCGCESSQPDYRPRYGPCDGNNPSGRYDPTCRPTNWPPWTPGANSTQAQQTLTLETPPSEPDRNQKTIKILVDDFKPQPYQGETVYFYNRLGGDRGSINNSIVEWGAGQVKTSISTGNSWGGVWMSLDHPIGERIPINFSSILPPQIAENYQSQITGLSVVINSGTAGRTLKFELKYKGEFHWKKEIILNGGSQVVTFDLPELDDINEFLWVLDHANAGDYVVLEEVSFTATTKIMDTATAAFVWSYGMLLNNWNTDTGLVRDKSKDPSGVFDAIQATGSLAAATAMAEQLGVVTHADAVQIVTKISETLLDDLPRFEGLWPHWVQTSSQGEITIVSGTEWSSVDTVIAALGLLTAQAGLEMDTSGTEEMLQEINWDRLVLPNGISHGYMESGELIPYAWDVFGGESWLVELVYASVTGRVAPISYPSPPTANGSGFIDEMAWLFVPPPSEQDVWGTDWTFFLSEAAEKQISYYMIKDSQSCYRQLGWYGLSAAEVPDPSSVPQHQIYQAFGVGGQFAAPNEGEKLLGSPVIIPHYAAITAYRYPREAVKMWDWLIDFGYFSPLTNVESVQFPMNSNCEATSLVWNQLKGSWNLSLQTLGWGRYLAERNGEIPILWEAISTNPLLEKGFQTLVTAAAEHKPETSHPIPGKIEAEEYDFSGKGVAYHDTSPSNIGSEFRSDDVDIEATTDVDGGYNVGWIEEGEWLDYSVEVDSSGLYDIQIRVASAKADTIQETHPTIGVINWTVPATQTLHIEFDGNDVSGPLTFVATEGWQNWKSVFARRIPLLEGQFKMRIVMDSSEFNINWISFAHSRPSGESLEETIDWLISQMTVEEKIEQLHGIDWMDTADNIRIGIPGFRVADGPHGLRGGHSTSFPVGIAMASTWDLELLERVGTAISLELLGKGRNQWLGPCLDITRDPRNGRSPESGGEEPFLIGHLGAAMIQGAQKTHVIATPKHFAATNHQQDRRNSNHLMDARTWHEFYAVPFRMAVQDGGAWSMMNAYNWINDLPSSANEELLTKTLRDRWGFPYYVISDWGSVYTSAADAINAGMDLEMPHLPGTFPQELMDSINNGAVSTETLDEAVHRVLRTKLTAGFLGNYPIGNPSDVCSLEHRELALEAAQKSMILLKNEDNILPLDPNTIRSIALIGPSADEARLDGIGSSVVEPCYAVTPLQGIQDRVPGITIHYVKGSEINGEDSSGFPAAIEAAQNADIVIFVGGLDNSQEGEELDRVGGSVQFPRIQQELINEIAAVNPNLIVVLQSGGIVALDQTIDNVKGLLYAFYPGQEGGNSIADILFGDINPSGKLPVTMPKNDDQLPDWNDLDFSGDLIDGFGYRWFDTQGLAPQFAFGYGLSYTSFEYENLVVSWPSSGGASVLVSFDVTNTGPMAGDEIVQLYLSVDFSDTDAKQNIPMPVKQLRGFERVSLLPAQTQTITFSLGPEELFIWSIADDGFRVEAGKYTIQVGGSSDDLPLSEIFNLTSSILYDTKTGEKTGTSGTVLDNIALDRPVNCFSEEVDEVLCGNAVEGDLKTRWSSQFSDPLWITVDLRVPVDFERVILHWEKAFGKAYQIQTSDNAVQWTDLYSTMNGDGGVDNLEIAGNGRYLRVRIMERGTGWGVSLWELQVYGRVHMVDHLVMFSQNYKFY